LLAPNVDHAIIRVQPIKKIKLNVEYLKSFAKTATLILFIGKQNNMIDRLFAIH
jgi:hypothetical protein